MTPVSVICAIHSSSKKRVCDSLIIYVARRWATCDINIDYCTAVHHLHLRGTLWNFMCCPQRLIQHVCIRQEAVEEYEFFLAISYLQKKTFHSFQDTILPR